MKGKYAQRANRTRDLGALDQRALAAEHERDRLAVELGRTKERREREVSRLSADLASARQQRDEAVSPKLAAADERIRELSGEVAALKESDKSRQQIHNKILKGVLRMLVKTGLTQLEAEEFLLNMIIGDGKTRRIADTEVGVDRKGRPGNPEAILAIQRSRGMRSVNDGTSVFLDALREASEGVSAP